MAAGRMLPRWGEGPPPIEIAGGISLRVGNNPDLEMYGGHIGYNVYPPVRGNHYAERACRLLLPLARAHGLRRIWITCNPDNFASRRTCERLGCRFAEIVPVPPEHPLYQRGDIEKCRYWLDLWPLSRSS
jgi:tagatose 1,6-diphosphate aldolase